MSTLLFDSTNPATPFDGTKTLAQLGLTDPTAVSSFVGGKLRVTGVANGWKTSYVFMGGYSGLYPSISVTFDAAQLTASSTLVIAMRNQADTSKYFFGLGNTAWNPYVQEPSGYHVLGQVYDTQSQFFTFPLAAGPTTFSVDAQPDVAGTVTFTVTLTNGGVTKVNRVAYLAIDPVVAGSAGVGSYGGGPFDFTSVKISDNALPAIARKSKLYIGLGDSITSGVNTTDPRTKNHIAIDGVTLGNTWDVVNLGEPGQATPFFIYSPQAVQALLALSGYTDKVVNFMLGTNDGITPAIQNTTNTNLTSLVSNFRSYGATRVYIGTLLPRNGSQPFTVTNPYIKAGSTGADRVVDYAAILPDSTTADFGVDQLHPSDQGQAKMANGANSVPGDIATLGIDYPSILPDPYQSPNAVPVDVQANYKPGAPSPFTASGLGTFLLPTVVLTFGVPANLPGGRIVILRRNFPGGSFAIIGNVTGVNASTPPVGTYTDTAVTNGSQYEYTAYALPYGDF